MLKMNSFIHQKHFGQIVRLVLQLCPSVARVYSGNKQKRYLWAQLALPNIFRFHTYVLYHPDPKCNDRVGSKKHNE